METVDITTRTMVSERTAKPMVARLLYKLGVSNQVAGAAMAGRFGPLDDPAGGIKPIISWLIRHASSKAGPEVLFGPPMRGLKPFRA